MLASHSSQIPMFEETNPNMNTPTWKLCQNLYIFLPLSVHVTSGKALVKSLRFLFLSLHLCFCLLLCFVLESVCLFVFAFYVQLFFPFNLNIICNGSLLCPSWRRFKMERFIESVSCVLLNTVTRY